MGKFVPDIKLGRIGRIDLASDNIGMIVQDEGSGSTIATTLNIVGENIEASVANNVVTVTHTEPASITNQQLQSTPTSVIVSSNEITITPGVSRYFIVDVSDDITTVNITAPYGACDFTILLQFTGSPSSSYSVDGFPASVSWIGTNTPAFSATGGEEILIVGSYFNEVLGYRFDASSNYTP